MRTSRPWLIAATTIGNALEFFDFGIYSYFAIIIGKNFFPSGDSSMELLLSLATFGVGYFMRPFGAAVLGAYADRKGRKPAMLLTLLLMAIGTGVIGLTPAYSQIGVFAPLLVLCGRLIQGFSVGGELGASTALLVEYSPADVRGYNVSWQLASQGLSILMAAGVAAGISSLLPPEAVEAWGWRVAFLLGVAIIPLALFLRVHLEETYVGDRQDSDHESLLTYFLKYKALVFKGLGLVVVGAATFSVVVLYLSTYAIRELGIPLRQASLAGVVAGVILLVTAPLFGKLSDRVGRRPVIGIGIFLMFILVYPGFLILNANPNIQTLLAVVAVLSVAQSMGSSPSVALVTENFPSKIRATGLSLVYAFGVSVFGGLGQFFATWLIRETGSKLSPAFYVMGVCPLALLALYESAEKAGKPLE